MGKKTWKWEVISTAFFIEHTQLNKYWENTNPLYSVVLSE